jgi:hypothetical protein
VGCSDGSQRTGAGTSHVGAAIKQLYELGIQARYAIGFTRRLRMWQQSRWSRNGGVSRLTKVSSDTIWP